ncbi:hypothetical protein WJX74_006475 [Apatococcus lobatus]|uniref:Amino acid transporter transmembrane domain-containing protein n=1 Tax=Apatococcus lobatus TaxID=904363 RepID=A0AAW1RDC0_9CHLO
MYNEDKTSAYLRQRLDSIAISYQGMPARGSRRRPVEQHLRVILEVCDGDKSPPLSAAGFLRHQGACYGVTPPAANFRFFESPEESTENASSANSQHDKELPVTAAQNGNWWSMAASIYLGTMGVAALNWPHAMASLTWVGGVITNVLAFFISFYTLYEMLEMHEMKGRRCNRYRELGRLAFGAKGPFICGALQYGALVAIVISYLVICGESMHAFYNIVCRGDCPAYGRSAWIATVGCVSLLLGIVPNMSSIKTFSALAAFAGVAYTAIGVGGSVSAGLHAERDTGHHAQWNLDGRSTVGGIFEAWAAFGAFVYSYGTHAVVLECQAQIPSPSFRPALAGSIIGYLAAGFNMFSLAFAGYWAFGQSATEVIFLGTIPGPQWMLALADLLVVVSLLGQWQLFIMPIFDAMEGVLLNHISNLQRWQQLLVRVGFSVLITLIGVIFPFFGDFAQLVGAVAAVPNAFILPALIHQRVMKPPASSWRSWANWGINGISMIVVVLGAAGSGRSTVLAAIHNDYFA